VETSGVRWEKFPTPEGTPEGSQKSEPPEGWHPSGVLGLVGGATGGIARCGSFNPRLPSFIPPG
jgi:hypothetical protein